MKGHTIDRCFEIIGYPPGFKKNPNGNFGNNNKRGFSNNNNRGGSSNNVEVQTQNGPLPFTNDQIAKLMSLIGEKENFGVQANMAGIEKRSVLGTLVSLVVYMCLTLTRLGHPSDQVLKVLKSSLKITKPDHNDPCDICHFSKQTREPFPFSDHTSESLGDLIHLDLWGPYRITSREGYSPNDDGEGPSDDAGEVIVDHWSTDTAKEQSFDDDVHTASSMDDNPISEDDDNLVFVNTRRSSRMSKLPDKLNDFVLDNKVKYGLNRKAIKSKIKYKSNGKVERYKARLVAKGCGQKEGIDYDEIFSPVVKMSTVRCFINMAVQNSWNISQLDVNNAFLYGDLNEDVYMIPPPGFFDKNDTRVCKLVKSLYGLKQAPRQWNKKLVETLSKVGFLQSKNDHSLFTKHKDGMFLALLVYVDDIIITGNNNDEITKFKTYLNQKFKIKDLGELKFFLGIEVVKIKNGLCLNQRKYCIELLYEYGLLACKPVATPMPENGILANKETDNDKPLKDITSYQKIVGKLIYLCNTRPDIAYYVHCLSQHMHFPLQSHFEAALRVLRYLKSAPGAGIRYSKTNSRSVCTYADSDWAKCKMIRKSVSGYCVFISGCLVYWKSKKQATLSRSSVEAEYRSMASAVCEVMWITKILKDLNFSCHIPALLFCDNSSAILIAANPVMHEKTKHFDIDVHLVREKVASGLIKTVHVDSEDQIVDILTKGLGSMQHGKLFSKLSLLNLFGL
ncbi:putative RNA-directed DNA polymerase [Tanacetum coccineum]|uniref:RNA-directed DNA polymerase n=1 Tax=Tanacetum coccineum TaxID=301880 RepID=A0ABQ5GTL2_9ASTR